MSRASRQRRGEMSTPSAAIPYALAPASALPTPQKGSSTTRTARSVPPASSWELKKRMASSTARRSMPLTHSLLPLNATSGSPGRHGSVPPAIAHAHDGKRHWRSAASHRACRDRASHAHLVLKKQSRCVYAGADVATLMGAGASSVPFAGTQYMRCDSRRIIQRSSTAARHALSQQTAATGGTDIDFKAASCTSVLLSSHSAVLQSCLSPAPIARTLISL